MRKSNRIRERRQANTARRRNRVQQRRTDVAVQTVENEVEAVASGVPADLQNKLVEFEERIDDLENSSGPLP